MPVYPFKCGNCNVQFDVIKHVSEYSSVENCPSCFKPGKRIFTSPTLFVTGAWVKEAEQKATLNGETIIEPGVKKELAKNRLYQQEKTRKEIRKVAEKTVMDLVI